VLDWVDRCGPPAIPYIGKSPSGYRNPPAPHLEIVYVLDKGHRDVAIGDRVVSIPPFHVALHNVHQGNFTPTRQRCPAWPVFLDVSGEEAFAELPARTHRPARGRDRFRCRFLRPLPLLPRLPHHHRPEPPRLAQAAGITVTASRGTPDRSVRTSASPPQISKGVHVVARRHHQCRPALCSCSTRLLSAYRTIHSCNEWGYQKTNLRSARILNGPLGEMKVLHTGCRKRCMPLWMTPMPRDNHLLCNKIV